MGSNLLLLGSALSLADPETVKSVIAYRFNNISEQIHQPKINSESNYHINLLLYASGNMGVNSFVVSKQLIEISTDRKIPNASRRLAIKSLRGSSALSVTRESLANAFIIENDEPFIQLEIVKTAYQGIKNKIPLQLTAEHAYDSFDKALVDRLDSIRKELPSVSTVENQLKEEILKYMTKRFTSKSAKQRPFKTFSFSTQPPAFPKSNSHVDVEKRGNIIEATKDWNSNESPSFDLVEPLSERQNDISQFPERISYLLGKRVGWDKLHFDVAAGAFGGMNNGSCLVGDMKTLARGRASITAFGHSYDLLDTKVFATKTDTESSASIYANVMGKTIYDRSMEFNCQTFDQPLGKIESPVGDFHYNIPIYIAFIEVGLTVSAGADLHGLLTVCPRPAFNAELKATAFGSIEGSGKLSILVAKGGLGISGTISYSVGPALRVMDPRDGCTACAAVYAGSDENHLDIVADVSFLSFTKQWNLASYHLPGGAFAEITPRWCLPDFKTLQCSENGSCHF